MGKYYLPRMCSYWEPWYFLVKSMTAWMKFFSDLFSIWRSNKNVLSQLCLTNSFCGQGKRSLLRLWRVRRYLIVVAYEVISFILSLIIILDMWCRQQKNSFTSQFSHNWLRIKISIVCHSVIFFCAQLKTICVENRLLKSFCALACERFPLMFLSKGFLFLLICVIS